ncbi:MAG: RNA 2',3'-cyclic phosphodiesterase [Planctomycetota bacterium]|nr:MAG: RNA 2',3'-cyclic phosphodiesterase [Planctomycetota bacterium]
MSRLFVALALPDSIQEQLASLALGLPGARWTESSPFHLTLAFLGELDGPQAQLVEDGLYGVRADPFELRLSGVGHFPPRGEPKVLWAGVAPDDPVIALQRAVRRRLARLGVTIEARRYVPHITLARLRHTPLAELLRWMEAQIELSSEQFPITHFELVSSVLGREGARHRVRAAYPLFARGPR